MSVSTRLEPLTATVAASGQGGVIARLRRGGAGASGVAGLLAILAGGALALAPVNMSETTVEWPQRGAQVESTVLLLTNQTPYTLDLAFDADTVASAANGTVFATMDPARNDAAELGLVITATDTGIEVASGGETEQVGVTAGAAFELRSAVDGLTVTRDGETVLDWPAVLPPQVDGLITDAPGDAALTAKLLLVDDFNTTPTLAKIAVMIVLWTALAYALFALWRDDRTRLPGAAAERRAGGTAAADRAADHRPWWRRLALSDAVVVVGLAAWVFLGPMTDDDGYYANMSLNYGEAGYVGNFYQMYNGSFTPFTWLWQALYFWQELGGRSPVWLRIPALLAATIAWFLTRRFVDRMLEARTGWYPRVVHGFLALVYLSWWLPYAIGTRPEILGALGSAIALALVSRSIERGTLLPAAFAAIAAGLAFAAHPTGAAAFAPLAIAVPGLWRIARRDGGIVQAAARTVGVASAGSVALFAAFADGSLNDFLGGRDFFASVETPLSWVDEAQRYSLLFSYAPMGGYAKRAVVLVALVAMLWFAALWMAAKLRRAPSLTFRVTVAGWSLATSFVSIWVTSSKWTHHFGAFSVLGPVLLTTALLIGPRLLREVLGDRPIPGWLAPAVVISFIPPIVVALSGPNLWAYSWDQFMYRQGVPPQVGPVSLASLPIWVAVAVAAVVGVGLLLRRRTGDWRRPALAFSGAAMVGVFFVVSTGFLTASFANAAVRGLSSFSVGAANLLNPLGGGCGAEDAITVWPAEDGAALTAAGVGDQVFPPDEPLPQSPAPELVTADGLTRNGYPASDPPPGGGLEVWADSGGGEAAARATGWYDVPRFGDGQRVGLLVGGSATEESASGVQVQVGYPTGDGVEVTREVWLTDTADRPGWRTLTVAERDLSAGTVFRLVGVDGSTGPGDWFGFSEPRLIDGVPMPDLVAHGSPTLVAWQSSFWFPCQRPMTIANGVIEPPVLATTWGDGGPDNIWADFRGGALVGPSRIGILSTPFSEMTDEGSGWGRIVTFAYPYPVDAYTLTQDRRTVMGWATPFGTPPQLVAARRDGRL